jgi:N-acetylglucosamine-6-phosphate deacetylase
MQGSPLIFAESSSSMGDDMPATAIYASRILTPQEEILDSVMTVEDGRITGISHRDEAHIPPGATDYVASGMTVIPGFVDVHIHGAGGRDVMEATPEALDKITATVARFGTTSMVATTVTAPIDATCKSLAGIAKYIRAQKPAGERTRFGAEILGVHLEGPFIAHARRGVHPPESIAPPSVPVFKQLVEAADGLVKMVTVAPEIPGAMELIAEAVKMGIVVGIGHTDATYEQARKAIEAGARHGVHVFNAMRPFTHRDPGVIAAILTDTEVTAEIIADNVHVAPPAMQVLLGTKGFDTVIAISDGISATGMPDGRYRLGEFEVNVKDGVARSAEGNLAGSTLTLDRALRNLVGLGVPFADAVRMATVLPARRLGVAGKKGILVVGADADIAVLRPEMKLSGIMTCGVGLS